ncbi:MAG: superoxide dismutase [Epulopiscium sp. Nele67-Bin005]|nr:MAG: superoxide dismutase [Epulopiscium sp. Nele67-Bin005]
MPNQFQLVPLPYAYNALEPFIDEETVHIHHDKHQQAYLDKFNAAIGRHPELFTQTVTQLVTNPAAVPLDIRQDVTNQGGGVFNHTFFWKSLSPTSRKQPQGKLADAITKTFTSFEEFKTQFKQHAISNFGSGWTWLVKHPNGDLQIINTANQDSPISMNFCPLITIDLWEHAYYLKYQNKRPDFIDAYFNIINWEQAEEFYENGLGNSIC